MSYTSSIPVTGDTLGGTRDRIRTNFQQIATVEAINHIAFGASGQGKHKFLQLPEVTASGAGVPSTAANEGGLYCDVADNVCQLLFRRESNGSVLNLTSSNTSNTTAQAANGYSSLPGGLLIQWGTENAPSGTSGFFNFPTEFGAVPYSLVVTAVRSSNGQVTKGYPIVISTTPTTSQFKVNNGFSNAHDFYYIAIGKAKAI